MGLNDIFARLKEREEKNKKAIPSQVFFNRFYAVNYQIEADANRFDLRRVPYFNNLTRRNINFNLDTCRKLLWNSWSTEYAFSLNSLIDNIDYYKFALHWNFPQAYYSVYLSMTGFHETQGIANDQHEKSIKIFGNSIKDNHYPEAISFFAKGLHDNFEYKGLNTFDGFPKDYSVLSRIESLEDAHIHIASFLKSTRTKNAEHKREKLKVANDKKFFNKSGKFRQTFNKHHWDLIYITIPETTILNMMYRLRIKANYLDVETFINADIDFKTFHQCLGNIIYYFNFVHEAYICKIIGRRDYESILNGFPNHLNKDTAVRRYNEHITGLIA